MVVSGAEEKREQKEGNRRNFLKTLGVAGVTMALAGTLSTAVFAAEISEEKGLRRVANIASLLSLPLSELTPGELVLVGGYYSEGDGCTKLMRWVPDSLRYDNGGTVHNPHATNEEAGRFEIVHDGVGDYRWFGLFDESKAADDAYQAMLGDGNISTIRAQSNLLFLQRIAVNRSRITLDFNGYTVYTYGSEGDKNSGGATFWFAGKTKGNRDNITLSEDFPEYNCLYPVSDSSGFAVGQWYTLQSDIVPGGGSSERELQRLCKVIDVPDSTHVRFDYELGWPLAAGRKISYQQVQPVHDVCIKNMFFEGNGRPTTVAGDTGSNPISFEFAVRCDVYNCHATQTFWSMIFRRYNAYYTTEKCSLYNPVEIQVGGTGYLTQQIACTYGVVRDCVTAQMRHLTDFTGSAYCEVTNCHAVGDNMGPFITHGQYEHDLTFIGNSGLIGLTNTMTNWGRAAKNVLIKNHTGAAVQVQNFVTNVTLENVHTFQEPGMVYAGMIKANVDGLVIKNCHADTMLMLSQYCRRGSRETVIADSTFNMMKSQPLGRIGAHVSSESVGIDKQPIWSPVTFRNCTFEHFDENHYYGIGELFFERCTLKGESKSALPSSILAARTRFVDCTLADMAFVVISNERAQKMEFLHTKIEGENEHPFIEVKNVKYPVTFDFEKLDFSAKGASMIVMKEGAKISRLVARNCAFNEGKAELAPENFPDDAVIFVSQSFAKNGFSLGTLPPESERVQYKSGLKEI